jgi:hypothetical protein
MSEFSKLNWLKRTNGHKFKPAEFRVLIAIYNHTDGQGQRAFPGLKLLAEETGHSKSTVSEAVTALRNAGWITETSRGSGVSGNASVLALVPDAPNPPSSSSGEEQPSQMSSSRIQEQPTRVVPVERTSSSPFQEQVVPGPRKPSDPGPDPGSDPSRSDHQEVRLTPNHLEGQDETAPFGRSLAVEGRTEDTNMTEPATASEGGTEAPKGIVSLQPPTAGSSKDDPWAFCEYDAQAAREKREREKRAEAAERERYVALAAANDPWA